VLYTGMVGVTLLLGCVWIVYHIAFVRTRVPWLRGAPDQEPDELVTIIVPARNEEANIVACLETLVAQDYTRKEIIVVDDGSQDATAELVSEFAASHPEVRLVCGNPLEDGWIGKTFALSQGVAAARGEIFVFVDADTRFRPSLLRTALERFKADAGAILSLLPHIDSPGFWERVVNPFVAEMFLVSMPFDKVNDPSSRIALSNGQFLMTTRSFLDDIGGLASIRDNILDDIALARKAKSAGRRVSLYYGAEYLHVRMYDSLRSVFMGWSKNFYRGFALNYPPILIVGVVAALLCVYVAPLIFPLAVLLLPLAAATKVAAFAPLAIEILSTWWKRARYGLNPDSAWTIPVGAAIYIAIVVNSTIRTVSGIGVQWKGRSYYKR
jgi:chlorobactene glucosyltransferase